jgi:hypothetical protein
VVDVTVTVVVTGCVTVTVVVTGWVTVTVETDVVRDVVLEVVRLVAVELDAVDAVELVDVVVVGGQGWLASTRKSPCARCAGQAFALTLILTQRLLELPVRWQTLTLPDGRLVAAAVVEAAVVEAAVVEATVVALPLPLPCPGDAGFSAKAVAGMTTIRTTTRTPVTIQNNLVRMGLPSQYRDGAAKADHRSCGRRSPAVRRYSGAHRHNAGRLRSQRVDRPSRGQRGRAIEEDRWFR